LVHSYLIRLASVVIRLTPNVKGTCLKLRARIYFHAFCFSVNLTIVQRFTFSNYYLHIQQLLSSQSVIIIFTFSILFSSFIRNSYACPLYYLIRLASVVIRLTPNVKGTCLKLRARICFHTFYFSVNLTIVQR
jgi:ABC-type uncharacterized transport system permease subunit